VLLCDLDALEPALIRRIGQHGDAEAEHRTSFVVGRERA
jgi:hypothetical protein